jgi:hypothetical protein
VPVNWGGRTHYFGCLVGGICRQGQPAGCGLAGSYTPAIGGAFLVEAKFAVGHPSLPRDGVYATARKLRESERRLAALDENSFQPPLSLLKAILRSMASARQGHLSPDT